VSDFVASNPVAASGELPDDGEVGMDELGMDELGMDELGMDELGVDELGVDELGVGVAEVDRVASAVLDRAPGPAALRARTR
jgi:hypothetical protein